MPAIAQPAHFAAPVGGWNSLDAIAAMPPTDAVRLDNLFPETSGVRLRRGSQTFYTINSTAPVSSIMTYSGSAAIGEHLLAAAGGTLYDITNKTSVSIGSGSGSDAWEYVNFATPGGQYWVGVNGNAYQYYWNGSGQIVAGTNTLGPNLGTMNFFSMVCSFQSRLFFLSPKDLTLYYLPVNVLQGEMHGMDLGSFLPQGGSMAFIGTWTRDDSTMGMNDLLVIGTTEGEVLIYRGVDPDDPSNWFMVGRFECGRPVAGHRQLTRLGPDMLLINEDGFQSLSDYLSMGQSKALTTAISHKIGNAVTQAALAARSSAGWCAILYAAKNAMLVNVPQPGGGFQQYTVNTITGSWCRFIGLNAFCWTLFADSLYFGAANGAIIQADIGGTDNGVPIAFDLVTAFQIFGNNMKQKRATMVRPFMIATGSWYPVMDVNIDYTLSNVYSPVAIEAYQTNWDQFNWDQAEWADAGTPQHDWYSVEGVGTSFAVRLSGTAQSASLQLMAFDVAYEAAEGFV